MTYVVTDACIRCKYMDCVEVCPVDCFYEGENMLVINPNECIDCGVWSFLRVTFGHCAEKVVLTSSHFSRPFSVSGRIASAGHSGSHTPQSMHSLGLMTSMFSPS